MEKIELSLVGDQKELIIRTGDAAKILPKVPIKEKGNIKAPANFHKIRPGVPDKSVVTFSRQHMSIFFEADPEDSTAAKIQGTLLLNPDLTKFEINTDKLYSRENLAKFLKMNKTFFKEKDKVDSIVYQLMHFSATITSEIENSKDGRGNTKNLLDRKTETKMPTEFTLKLPVFVGESEKTFRVEIGIDSTDSSVKLWLESSELQDIIITERDRIINEEIAKFEGLIIIEQ